MAIVAIIVILIVVIGIGYAIFGRKPKPAPIQESPASPGYGTPMGMQKGLGGPGFGTKGQLPRGQ